ncbi:MAG: ATP-binding cassette domain-containing protein [Micropruina sp.]|uniref:ABC transporter ATP-binding protein n=1 Tax=Micropruina sp. TaxID=2737536 RepID=UPI0039E33B52
MRHAVHVRGLRVHTASGTQLVDDVSFTLDEAERVALVGASGSGKSLTAAAVLGTLPVTLNASGAISVCGCDVLPGRLPRSRAGVAAVHQDPSTALNPLLRVGDQLGLVLRAHGTRASVASSAAAALLDEVGFDDPDALLWRYPAELSGGQRQRVCLAIALACRPRLLIADEPTTALDLDTQEQVLDAIERVRQRHGTALMLITHDRRVATTRTDRAIRMAQGRLVDEAADAEG